MPRPKKCRRVCEFPQTLHFTPENLLETAQPVTLQELAADFSWDKVPKEDVALPEEILRKV